ncbi:hypothetical protein MFUL124B02_17990 [Myxococcus fulvus 124B02]|nr:hypothetical protein MFUL124B02_17990 [Myxococcus fulvus 124B02]
MLTRYFRLTEAVQAGHWSLGPSTDEQDQELDAWTAHTSRQVPDRIKLRIREKGRRRDFNLVGASGVPVLHAGLAALFAEFTPQEVQLVPVDIKGCGDEYSLLIATRVIDLSRMRTELTKAGDPQVFRAGGSPGALIVSEHIKLLLERARLTGAAFEEV